jgi:CRP-like cAMP-binding protein
MSRGRVHLLEADPDLGAFVPADERETATRAAIALTERYPRGSWDPAPMLESHTGGVILAGLAVKELSVAGTVSAELLGPGDVLLPVAERDVVFLTSAIGRTVVEPVTVAWLGAPFQRAGQHWPGLYRALLQRAQARSARAAMMQNIAQMTRIEDRVLILLWHLAERFGRVTSDGVIVPLRLTHNVIARLVGARRPSVTTAISALERRGLLARRADGAWGLDREPAGELLAGPSRPAPWRDGARARTVVLLDDDVTAA